MEAAHDERYELMRAAAARARGLRPRLVGILTDLFRYLRENRQMLRLSFATAFAAAHELPCGLRCRQGTRRNFEFIQELMKEGQRAGELDAHFDPSERRGIGLLGLNRLLRDAEYTDCLQCARPNPQIGVFPKTR